MALFPQSFLDDLKAQTDIVAVIGDVVPLKKMGATWKGLCPFHRSGRRRSTSTRQGLLQVLRLRRRRRRREVRRAAAEGVVPRSRAVPGAARGHDGARDARAGRKTRGGGGTRGAAVKLHEQAAAFYREQLATPAGARARRELEQRGLAEDTIGRFGYGYAPAAGRETLAAGSPTEKVPVALQLKSGLVVERDGGRLVDRFRNRLMIPIARDTGAIVAFGGRALDEDRCRST